MPGNDRNPIEFYETLWPLLGKFMVGSFNEASDKKEMSPSQKQAIFTPFEKKGKRQKFLENWKPISLINVDAKIASKGSVTQCNIAAVEFCPLLQHCMKQISSCIHHLQHFVQ